MASFLHVFSITETAVLQLNLPFEGEVCRSRTPLCWTAAGEFSQPSARGWTLCSDCQSMRLI